MKENFMFTNKGESVMTTPTGCEANQPKWGTQLVFQSWYPQATVPSHTTQLSKTKAVGTSGKDYRLCVDGNPNGYGVSIAVANDATNKPRLYVVNSDKKYWTYGNAKADDWTPMPLGWEPNKALQDKFIETDLWKRPSPIDPLMWGLIALAVIAAVLVGLVIWLFMRKV